MGHDTSHGRNPTTVSREIPRTFEDLVRMGLLITRRIPTPCAVTPSRRFTVGAEFRGLTALEAYRRRGVDGDNGDPQHDEARGLGFIHFGVRPTFKYQIERELYEREDVAYSNGALVVEREAKLPFWTVPIELRRAIGCSHPSAQRLVGVNAMVQPDYKLVSKFVRGFRRYNRAGKLSAFEQKMRALEDIAWVLWAEEPKPTDALHRAVSVYEPDRIGEGDQVPGKLREEPLTAFRKTTWVPWERATEDKAAKWKVRSRLGRQLESRISRAPLSELKGILRQQLREAGRQLPVPERQYLWSLLRVREAKLTPIGRIFRVISWLKSTPTLAKAKARRSLLGEFIYGGKLAELVRDKVARDEATIRLWYTLKTRTKALEAEEAAQAAIQECTGRLATADTKEARIQAINAALRKGAPWSVLHKMLPAGAFA